MDTFVGIELDDIALAKHEGKVFTPPVLIRGRAVVHEMGEDGERTDRRLCEADFYVIDHGTALDHGIDIVEWCDDEDLELWSVAKILFADEFEERLEHCCHRVVYIYKASGFTFALAQIVYAMEAALGPDVVAYGGKADLEAYGLNVEDVPQWDKGDRLWWVDLQRINVKLPFNGDEKII